MELISNNSLKVEIEDMGQKRKRNRGRGLMVEGVILSADTGKVVKVMEFEEQSCGTARGIGMQPQREHDEMKMLLRTFCS